MVAGRGSGEGRRRLLAAGSMCSVECSLLYENRSRGPVYCVEAIEMCLCRCLVAKQWDLCENHVSDDCHGSSLKSLHNLPPSALTARVCKVFPVQMELCKNWYIPVFKINFCVFMYSQLKLHMI